MQHTLAKSVLVLTALAGRVDAQSTIGAQGFGYPPGQLSARAYATGGSVGEMDPWSPINPASLSMLGARLLFFQMEPEYRTVKTASGTDRTTTARYPLVFGAMRFGENWVFSLGASTLLDRTSTTRTLNRQPIGLDSIDVTTTFKIDGAVNDLRLAAAWSAQPWLRLGVGVHALTGRNLVSITESFSDTVSFVGFNQQRDLGFSGGAVSAGVHLVSKQVVGAASFRHGGTMHLSAVDTVIGTASVPDRFGVSIAYVGFANSTIAVRTSRDSWSAINGLGSAGLRARDAWDSSIGADMAGPRIGLRPLMLRAGARVRSLPFPAAGKDVDERSLMGGLGTLWAQGHIITDLAVIRATRDAGLTVSEKAWTISFGVTVRQ